MKSSLVLFAILGVAFAGALHDSFASKPLNVKDGVFDPLTKNGPEIQELNDPPQIVNGVYTVPLNHFDPVDGRRLSLTFKSNVVYYETNGPIFININHNEGLRWVLSGLAHDLAREWGGAVITADIRFMGRNSLNNVTEEHSRFYNIHQMVADVGHLVSQVKLNLDAPESKVVVFGGRVGGTIAAFARKRFPHLIDGIWSSGGFFRFSDPNPEYFNSVSRNIFYHGPPQCAQSLSIALQNVTQLVEAGNRTRLAQLFNLCEENDFSDPLDAAAFYETVFTWITGYIDALHYQGILNICSDLLRGPDPLTAFVRWVNYVFGNSQCRNISYRSRLQQSRNFVTEGACTSTASLFFVTSPNVTGGVFPNVISDALYERRCSDIMGAQFNRTLLRDTIDSLHIQYGQGRVMISNAIFTVGLLDPFVHMGIIEHDIENSEVVHTTLHSAQADMTSLSDYDSADLRATKYQVRAALRRFTRTSDAVEPNDEPIQELDPFFNGQY